MNKQVSETLQRLIELNRLEDEVEQLKLHREPSAEKLALIESLRANITVAILMRHDRLRARGRKSLAEARHGVCSGCHMKLPVGTANELKRHDHVATCDNCGRFVFPAAEQEPPAPTTVSDTKPRRKRARGSEMKL